MAYIVENDVILHAVLKELDRCGDAVQLQNDTKISEIHLAHLDGETSTVQLKSGECYSCDLLVSL